MSPQDRPARFGYVIPPASTRETIRSWDPTAIQDYAIPGIILMENAGEACARVLLELLDDPGSGVAPPFHIICGPGNNGGDGLVIARHLFNRGVDVHLYLTTPCSSVRPGSDAEIQLRIAQKMGIPLEAPEGPSPPGPEVLDRATGNGTLVDAIFGTGLSRPLGPIPANWVTAMNDSGLPIVAIDIPSGLHADTGEILGDAIRARWTLTFVASKVGFEQEEVAQYTGEVKVLGISIPRQELKRRG